ncbi:MAG: SsrA-binding protein SmpB [Candidatus Aenigmatarchaeota archaeon]
MKVISTNRRAKHNYSIIETYEAGIELKGNEVKSLRTQGCSIDKSFVRIEEGEAFLYDMHIPEYKMTSYFKLPSKRIRKLLLHKKEINRLKGLTTQRGFTIIPLRVYFNSRGFVKVEIGLAKGKTLYDKRRKIKKEIEEREVKRALKENIKRYFYK